MRIAPIDPGRTRRFLRQAYKADFEVFAGFLGGITAFIYAIAVLPWSLSHDDYGHRHPWVALTGLAPAGLVVFAWACWYVGSHWFTEFPNRTGSSITQMINLWNELPDEDRALTRPMLDVAWAAGQRGSVDQVDLRARELRKLVDQLRQQAVHEEMTAQDMDPVRQRVEGLKLANDSTEAARKRFGTATEDGDR